MSQRAQPPRSHKLQALEEWVNAQAATFPGIIGHLRAPTRQALVLHMGRLDLFDPPYLRLIAKVSPAATSARNRSLAVQLRSPTTRFGAGILCPSRHLIEALSVILVRLTGKRAQETYPPHLEALLRSDSNLRQFWHWSSVPSQ